MHVEKVELCATFYPGPDKDHKLESLSVCGVNMTFEDLLSMSTSTDWMEQNRMWF